MCFSATASFFAGTVLIPVGGVALSQAWKTDRRYLMLAAFPVAFGIQQIFEGILWRSFNVPEMPPLTPLQWHSLFFAYLLWLVLAPLAAFMVEERTWLKRVFLGVTVFGAAYGLSLFVPLVSIQTGLASRLPRARSSTTLA